MAMGHGGLPRWVIGALCLAAIVGGLRAEEARPLGLTKRVMITVEMVDEVMSEFEHVFMSGDVEELGSWHPANAIQLVRTKDYNLWSNAVYLPRKGLLYYRYFIGTIEYGQVVNVRRWESHIEARLLDLDGDLGETPQQFDYFGYQDPKERVVQPGWLNSGRIVQFKLFRNPVQLYSDQLKAGEQLSIKVQPIDPKTLTPILPSARAYTEYVRMQYGNSFLRDQPAYGVPYEEDDIVIFQTTVSDLQRVAYVIRMYTSIEGSDLVRFIGYQYIYPTQLTESAWGLTVHLISPISLSTIGTMDIYYLIVQPLPNPRSVDLRTSFVDYWRGNWTGLEVGHRGLGRSLKQTTNAAPLIENTLASMKAAGDLGADMVEFDVQLTKDSIPIIYHDFYIYLAANGVKKPTSSRDLSQVPLKEMYYADLMNLTTYQLIGLEVVEYPAPNTVANVDERLFPTFESFLTEIDPVVGFDIEIKWPQRKRDGSFESSQTVDKNMYVDRILEVMLEHGCGRLSFFTSFDADICTLLRYKQNMYPVMMLYSDVDQYYADPRHDSLFEAVSNAQAFDLVGVVPNARFVLQSPGWVNVVMRQQKKMFLWGDSIDNTTSVEWFKAQGVTGVIYDRMDLWLPADKKNAFSLEDDLPEYFELQCSNVVPAPLPTAGPGPETSSSTSSTGVTSPSTVTASTGTPVSTASTSSTATTGSSSTATTGSSSTRTTGSPSTASTGTTPSSSSSFSTVASTSTAIPVTTPGPNPKAEFVFL